MDQPSRSLWQSKPWWCQPWTIVASGMVAIAISWLLLHLWWLTTLVLGAVFLWWTLFLWLVPRAYEQALDSQALGVAAEGGEQKQS
ncbi:MAG: hypothetical protein FJ077_02935 [Cyanobacteria bacterium K_DeepCast_35m_m2_023]|nr:hypothetical protein [Cyanobacteria bacterium K_DeepCast_35m_m2_023]